MIGGHAQVRDAAFEHPENRRGDAAHRSQLLRSAPVKGRGRREEVAEQLERPVDEMDDHDRNDTAGRPPREASLLQEIADADACLRRGERRDRGAGARCSIAASPQCRPVGQGLAGSRSPSSTIFCVWWSPSAAAGVT